jgi:hypothetical protein
VKVIDVDVSRRRISLSMRQVGGQALVPKDETEIEAEAPLAEPEAPRAEPAEVEAVVEPAADFAETEAAVEAAGEAGGAEQPEEAPVAAESAQEPEPSEPQAEEDVSLESILEDLKRREGRTD